jgi:putative CocE/NonD family hydrolase
MNRQFRLFLSLFVFLALTSFPLQAQEKAEEKETIPDEEAAKLAYDLPMSGHEDAGVFELYVNEEPVGTCDFTWEKSGKFRNRFTLSLGGQTVKTETEIVPDSRGVWQKIEARSPAGELLVEREGRLVRTSFRDQKSTLQLAANTILFENYSPPLLRLLLDRYDSKKGGKQTLSIYVAGARVIDGEVDRLGGEERAVEGKEMTFSRYHLFLKTVDVNVLADASGRVVLEDVPAQKAYFVRRGFETLAAKPVEDALLSKPEFELTVKKDQMVPMRDKITLATDLYLPKREGKVPAVLIRTPYGKELMELTGKYWARRGYACAIQDCRGRFKSKGVWVPFMNEGDDGYDTIEWLAARPFSDGKVGMIGGSYLGWVQWWAASRKPPHLVTIIPNVSPPDPHYNIPYEYGTFFLLGSIWWAKILETEATADLSGKTMIAVGEADYSKILKTLPVIGVDEVLLGKKNPYWRSWVEHPTDGSFWEKADFLGRLKDVDIPVFHQSGWFDGDGIGTKLNYLKMKSFGHKNQKLIVGPWGHTDTAHRSYGDRDFGREAVIDLQREYLRWFDYWLKGVKNGIMEEPLVRLFAMGSNRWLKGNTYPLEATEFRNLYLASGGKANSGKGDGILAWDTAASKADSDAYVYDPADPTPDPEFYPTKSKEELKKQVISEEAERKKQKAYHGEVDDKRQDILVYRTEPLEKPLTICGPLSAVIYASSSARDTDWFVSLSEETKEGEIFALARGKIRARYRNSLTKPEMLEPGEIVKYELDLWHTGITASAGNRLRVEVASALFPTFSRNLNTGGQNEMETEFVKADQKIFHTAEYPSHVLLPVIPEKQEASEPGK